MPNPARGHQGHCFVLTLALLAVTISTAAAEHYRVYFLGGQSNGNGRGDASQLTGVLAAPQADVRFYWHRTQATNNVGHLLEDQWIDLAPGSGHGTTSPVYAMEFGPELSFGRAMADADPSVKIALIKYTHGGTNLHTQWAASGARYASFVSTASAGLMALSDAGHSYELGGMIWHQGEADAGSLNNAYAYEANLTSLIDRVRQDVFGGLDLPFIVGSLSNSQNASIETPGTSWFVLRQAQEAVAALDERVGFVNTDGYTTRPGEAIHFDHEGQIAMGQGFAAEMLRIEALSPIVDTDGDGLSDDEEGTLGTNPAMADTDCDGQDDGLEVEAGTDPLSGASLFGITEMELEGDQVTLIWPSKVGNSYSVETSSDLSDWQTVASGLPAFAGASTSTTWVGMSTTDSSIMALYSALGSFNGDFDTTSFDSLDSDSSSVASRLNQGGSLTGGGASAFVLANALFDSSESGSPGFNLAGVATASRAEAESAGDTFGFTIQPVGETLTFESLSFYCDQFGTTAKIDVSYTLGGVEIFVLENFTPPGSNAPVALQSVDFEDFSASEAVSWKFYLYGASGATHGTRFDDIAIHGSGNDEPSPARNFYRILLE